MKPTLLIAQIAMSLLVAQRSASDTTNEELRNFEGTWTAVSIERR